MALVAGITLANSTMLDGQVVLTLQGWKLTLLVLGLIAIVPCVAYVVVLTFWHWKSRYRGRRSVLWGLILLVEWSGATKLLYLFRHVVPDSRAIGRYART
jgi:hypothetical protein